MSFDLLGLKKSEQQSETTSQFAQNVVVGEDFFSLLAYLELKKKAPNSTILICSKEVSERDLFPSYPSFLRGKEDIEFVKSLFPELSNVEGLESKPPMFFKDGDWKEFGGRAKPEKLLEMEDFFLGETLFFDLSSLFPTLQDPLVINEVNEFRETKEIQSIEITKPSDLVEKDYFHIHLSDGAALKCENLIWGRAPKSFIEHLSNKNVLSDQFIEYLEGLSSQTILNIEYYFDDLKLSKEDVESQRTLFVPQSYTHDWGHFICEYKTKNEQTILSVLCFIHDDSLSEEEIGKKIRLLKRNVEKVFSNFFSSSEHTEYIRFKQESLSLEVDDQKYQELNQNIKSVDFVSYSAPFSDFKGLGESLKSSDHKLSGLARAIGRFRQHKKIGD